MRHVLLSLAVLSLLSPALLARGGKKAAPEASVTEDGDLSRIEEKGTGGIAFLYPPKGLAEGVKGGLIVFLHGHGGTPKGVIRRDLADRKGWFFLSVQGGGTVETPRGEGHTWSTPDSEKALALTRWMVANRPVDPKKVVLIGFSAGGTMVLHTWKQDPRLFAGIITCSSPATPDSGHDAARIAVFLGTEDPNYSGAAAVRNRFEKRKTGGTLQVVTGSGHNDLPATQYFDVVLDWILAPKAIGHEVRLPKDPPATPDTEYRHILVSYRKAKGAPSSLRRKKSSAKSIAKKLVKALTGGRSDFRHEAQANSSDAESAPIGGAITLERLKAYGGELVEVEAALAKAKSGVAGPLESEAGFHIVMKAGK